MKEYVTLMKFLVYKINFLEAKILTHQNAKKLLIKNVSKIIFCFMLFNNNFQFNNLHIYKIEGEQQDDI